jgi:hypothetical protein
MIPGQILRDCQSNTKCFLYTYLILFPYDDDDIVAPASCCDDIVSLASCCDDVIAPTSCCDDVVSPASCCDDVVSPASC